MKAMKIGREIMIFSNVIFEAVATQRQLLVRN